MRYLYIGVINLFLITLLSSFSPLNMLLTVFLCVLMSYVEICSLYTNFLREILYEQMLNFVRCFFHVYCDDHVILSIVVLM